MHRGQRRGRATIIRSADTSVRRGASYLVSVTDYRLTHPDLDFWVDVTIYARDGRYTATADLAEDSRDIGVGDTPQEAVRRRWGAGGAVRDGDGEQRGMSGRLSRPALDLTVVARRMGASVMGV